MNKIVLDSNYHKMIIVLNLLILLKNKLHIELQEHQIFSLKIWFKKQYKLLK